MRLRSNCELQPLVRACLNCFHKAVCSRYCFAACTSLSMTPVILTAALCGEQLCCGGARTEEATRIGSFMFTGNDRRSRRSRGEGRQSEQEGGTTGGAGGG
eukprot:350228-Chlamydomonas_euryale.AAC.7